MNRLKFSGGWWTVLGALAFVGLAAYLVSLEGQRARQSYRDSRNKSSHDSQTDASGDPSTALPSTEPSARKSSARSAAAAQPPAPGGARPAAETPQPAEDFNLKDHNVFPGLAPPTSQPETKNSNQGEGDER
jgi:hypothetical protein